LKYIRKKHRDWYIFKKYKPYEKHRVSFFV
jgi:hypothetical protein